MKSWIRGLTLCALGLACGWLPVSMADEPKVTVVDDDSPALDRIRSDLIKVRSMLRNATIKFNNGVTGGISENEPALDGPPTPGKSCCTGNLVRLEKLFKNLDAALGELGACYEVSGDLGGADTLDLVQRDLQQLKKGVHLFQTMEEPSQAYQALAGTKRAYLLLDESQRDLPGCETAQ